MLSKWSKKYEHYKELRRRKEKIPKRSSGHNNDGFCYSCSMAIPTATATSLEEIKVSSEISAPVDQAWNFVSDVDDETKCWPTFKSIKNMNKTMNMCIQ